MPEKQISKKVKRRSLWHYYAVFVVLVSGALFIDWHYSLPAVLALLFFFGALIYRHLHQPLSEMQRMAQCYATGKFERRQPLYYLCEVSELAQSMNKMAAQLQHAEEIRGEFIANVSHELKTPITSVKGFVETLLDGAKEDSEDLQRFLEIIGKQADRLMSIVEDLLTLARLESGRIEDLMVRQEERVVELLQGVAEENRGIAEKKGIAITVKGDPELRAVFDRSLVEHAVANLVNNAIKYSGHNGQVELRAIAKDDQLEICVEDKGPGIAPEHLPRLFERFYRVDKARTRSAGGTGLGLAIVKHIAVVHGGKVAVESHLGQGSTFFFNVPMQ